MMKVKNVTKKEHNDEEIFDVVDTATLPVTESKSHGHTIELKVDDVDIDWEQVFHEDE